MAPAKPGHGPVKVIYHNPVFTEAPRVNQVLARLTAVQACRAIDGPRQRGGFSPNMRVRGAR